MLQAGFCRKLGRGGLKLPPAQSVEQIASEHDPLPLSARQALAGEMIDAAVHRIPYLGAKSTAARRRLAGEKLPVEPSRSIRRNLRLYGQVGSRGQ